MIRVMAHLIDWTKLYCLGLVGADNDRTLCGDYKRSGRPVSLDALYQVVPSAKVCPKCVMRLAQIATLAVARKEEAA